MFWNVRATLARHARSRCRACARADRCSPPGRLARARFAERVSASTSSRSRDALAREREPPFGRLVEAGDAVEHRRLAGAVRADQRGDVAAADLERQVVDGDEAAEAHRQMFDDEQGIGLPAHQPCPSLTRSPETALRSLRKIDGERVETKPRGLHHHHHHHREAEQQAAILRGIEIGHAEIGRHQSFSQPSSRSISKPPISAHRGERDADLRAHAAEHDDRQDRRRFVEGEALRADEALPHREERAGEAAEEGAERERGELGVGRVDAERAAGDLILAQRLPGAPDRQPAQPQRHEIGDAAPAPG